jgi:HSP20 family protein
MSIVERKHQLNPLQKSFWNDLFDRELAWPSLLRDGEMLPAINIKESENQYDLDLAVPGYKKDDFNVSIEKGVLTIKAEVKEEKEEKKDGYSRKEFSYRSFERNFALPDHVNEDSVQSKYENGLLHIILPKISKEVDVEKRKNISIS